MELLSLNGPEEQPQTLEELLEDGLMKLQGKLLKQGATQLHKALQMDPPKVSHLLSLKLQKSMQAQEWEISMALGATLLRAKPENADLANILGNCARRIGHFNLANNYYRHALKVAKDHQLARYNMGASLALSDKYDQEVHIALQPLMEFNELQLPHFKDQPNFAEEFPQEAAQSLNKTPNFGELLEFAETLAPTLAGEDREKLYFNLALLGLHQKEPKATKPLKSLIERESRLPNFGLLRILIQAMVSLKEGEELIQELQTLVDHEPNNRLALLNLGIAYKKSGNWLKSYKYLLQAHDLLEKSEGRLEVEDQISLAADLEQRHDLKRAENLYLEVLKQQELTPVRAKLAELQLINEEWDNAVETALPLAQNRSNRQNQAVLVKLAESFTNLAEDLRSQNKHYDAMTFYERAAKLVRDPKIFQNLVALCNHLKLAEKAKFYQEEYKQAQAETQEQNVLDQRDDLLSEAKLHLKNQQFSAAQAKLQQAWRIKPNKDAFMLLAFIYKNMKKQTELQDLLLSWKQFQEQNQG